MSKRREFLQLQDYKKKSKNFLLPLLETPLYHINSEINYLIDVNFVQIGFPQIVLIFDNIDYTPLKEDLYRLQNSYLYVDSEYDDDDKEVCMFFDVPKEYKKDFELFVQGHYSKLSNKYKELLTKTYGNTRLTGISASTGLPHVNIYDVIYPTENLIKLLANQLGVDFKLITEVLDPPNIDLEEYKHINELKK